MKKKLFFCVLILAPVITISGQWTGTSPIWTNSNVGIGISAPNEKLEVAATTGGIFITSDATGAQRRVLLIKSPTVTNDYASIYAWKYGTSPGAKNLVINETGGNVGIGTINIGSYKLNVLGTIRATEVVVNTQGADFVFNADYRLCSIRE